MKLAVNITTNGDRRFYRLDIALLNEYLFDLLTEDSELSFWQNGSPFDGVEPLINISRTHLCF